MKKFLAILIMLMAAFGCTACSDSLVGLVQTGAEMSALDKVQQTGEIVLLAESALTDDVTDCKFTFKSETDNKNLKAKLVGNLAYGDTVLPVTVYIDNVKIYFNTAELIAIYSDFATNSESVAELKSAFGNAEWLCINMLDDETWSEYQKVMLDIGILNDDLYDEIIGLFSSLKKAYSDFNSSIVTKKGSTYTVSLDNQSTIAFIENFLKYSAEHCTDIASALTAWVDESALFDNEYKAEIKSTVYAAVSMAQGLTDSDWAELEDELQAGAQSLPFDCSLKYSLTRNSAKSFSADFALDYKTTELTSDVSAFKLQGKSDTVAVNSVKIDIPTEKILNIDDVKTDNLTPKSVSATIYLDEDYMSYHHYYDLPYLQNSGVNTPNVRIINNTTYLGLRAVAEACGEEVGWSSEKKSAYVVRDGKPVYISGYSDTNLGRSYLKIRDFEKLGYVVDYTKTEITGQIVTLSR